jgi:hypothetical protein
VQQEDAGGRPVRAVIAAMAARGGGGAEPRKAKTSTDMGIFAALFFFFLLLLPCGIGVRRTAANILSGGLALIDERSCSKGTVKWREVCIKIGLLSRSFYRHYWRYHRPGSNTQTASSSKDTPAALASPARIEVPCYVMPMLMPMSYPSCWVEESPVVDW